MYKGGYKTVIENPYNQPHYLTTYFPLQPTIIDKDRTKDGDYYKKPTQYFFVNFQSEDNLVLEPLEYVKTLNVNRVRRNEEMTRQVRRSLLHPQYARRFILRHLAGDTNNNG